MKYRAKREEALTPDEMAVYDEFGFSENFARLLFIRGIDTKEKVKAYFNFSLDSLHDPFELRGMHEAVKRLEAAILNKERILIIGDYDADGICAVAILYKYFISRHASTRYFLPDRSDDGYGLNIELIDKLNKRFAPKVIITVDCGISCPKEIEYAKSLGIDCIVTDHHAIPMRQTCNKKGENCFEEIIPDCIVVSAKLGSQKYPFKDLAGAGVALKVVQGMGGIEAAEKYLDICAIATVADIVALKGENRIITALGLARLNQGSLPSITALAKSCNIHGAIKSSDISFKLGPKINASGRMGNAKRGLDLILEQNPAEIEKIIKSLGDYNSARQKLCNTIYEEVEKYVDGNKLYLNNIIVAADERWESGVLGIVAARLTEKHGRPSIIFGKSENVYKGSGRSIEDINIVKAVEQFSDLVSTFGGHSMAVGLSVPIENFDEFNAKLTKHMNEAYTCTDLRSEKLYDFTIDISDFTPEMVKEFEKIEPTGCENQMPLFMTTVTSCQVGSLSNFPMHLRFTHKGVQFMYFNGSQSGDVIAYNFPKKVVFEFQKLDDSGIIRGVAKNIIPIPTDAKSYALCLAGHLRTNFAIEGDIKFNNILNSLNCDREVFVEYYKFLKVGRGARAYNAYDLFAKLDTGANEDRMNLYQFVFCATVFQQLGILSFQNGYVVVNTNMTTDLVESSAYNLIRERGAVKVDVTKDVKTLA